MIGLMPVVFYVFALLTVAGGAFGTIKSHEPWSIIGSTVFGVISVAGGLMMKKTPKTGLQVGIVGAVLFTAFFVYTFIKSGKPMPAFGAIPMGVIVLVLAIVALGNLPKTAA